MKQIVTSTFSLDTGGSDQISHDLEETKDNIQILLFLTSKSKTTRPGEF